MAARSSLRERELFCECLDLTPEERVSWLRSMCAGDPALEQRILRLLDAHELAEQSTLGSVCLAAAGSLPETVDHYRIVRVIGEGGMGVVYEAQQDQPVRRRVALKAVKVGMDTRRVLARFALERQALAAMDHPYVAKVYDAGHTAGGRPYFAMEYVDGVPIHRHCDQKRLTVRERIELFLCVCQAVQHAHQKGIIHRDLKPSNVLVSSEFGVPLPKIIDFGIARAVAPDELDITLTRAEQILGTPAYMSPEQAGFGGKTVDTRSDVYSLGVMLYELLAGGLPAACEEPFECLHRLATGEFEVPRPSQCVKPEAAAPRRTTSAALRKQLTGDLDSILLKALETDRGRRYDSVVSFAADLERYLAGEPVAAISPTLAYRARKFVQRHRVQVTAAAIVAVAIAGGAIAGSVGFVRARRAEAAARQEATTAREVAQFLTRLFATSDPNAAPGSPVTVQQVLEAGTRRVQSDLKSSPEVKAALLGTLSHVHASLGSYKQAKVLAEQSLAAEPARADLRTAEVLVDLGRINQDLGQFDEARKALRRALDIRVHELGADHLDVSVALNLLGGLEGQLEHFENAIAFHRKALAIQEKAAGSNHIVTYNSWRGLGMLYDRQGNPKAALECFEHVLPIARARYGKVHPIVADALNNLGMVYFELDQFAESRRAYEESLEIRRKTLGPGHPSVAFTAHGLAKLMQHQGKLADAAKLLEEAIRIRTFALGAGNVRTGESLKALGLLRIAMGQTAEAKRLLGESLHILQNAYGANHTDTLRVHRDAALAFVKAGRPADAVPHLREVATLQVPERVRLNLNDQVLDPVRGSREFQNLAKDMDRP